MHSWCCASVISARPGVPPSRLANQMRRAELSKCIGDQKLTRSLTCRGSCGHCCYEDVQHPLYSVFCRVSVLAGLADKQHEDADLQQQCIGTEGVQVLQTQLPAMSFNHAPCFVEQHNTCVMPTNTTECSTIPLWDSLQAVINAGMLTRNHDVNNNKSINGTNNTSNNELTAAVTAAVTTTMMINSTFCRQACSKHGTGCRRISQATGTAFAYAP